MSDLEGKTGENDLERQNEHLEDSDFNLKRRRKKVLEVVVRGEVPRKKCNIRYKKMSIAKIVSNLAEQVHVLVEDNRTRSVVGGEQAKDEEKNGSKVRPQQQVTPVRTSNHRILGITSPLTHSRSENVDLRGPSLSLIGLMMKLTPTKERPRSMRSEGHGEAPTRRLNDIRQGLSEFVKSYFNRFQNELIVVESISDEKALDALWNVLRMETIFWRDVQNKRHQTYNQFVDLIKAEIQMEETIENRKKHESEIEMMT
ncbi:hypothetical protein Fot_24900 [Forsythia ovata]|uniref:Uncharacterized protein n=1 Tax=Forsythia ovata TaxID=205694 RepID=A0ABD1U7K0_9LAMI